MFSVGEDVCCLDDNFILYEKECFKDCPKPDPLNHASWYHVKTEWNRGQENFLKLKKKAMSVDGKIVIALLNYSVTVLRNADFWMKL